METVALLGLVVVAVTGCSRSESSASSDSTSTTAPKSGVATTEVDTVDPFELLVEQAARAEFGDPLDVEMPEPMNSSASEFLASDGMRLVAFVDQTQPMWESGLTACATVPRQLDALGPPEELLGLAAAIPDSTTVDVFTGLHTATSTLLSACGDPDTFEQALEEFSFTWVLASRRLDQLGVER